VMGRGKKKKREREGERKVAASGWLIQLKV
jgi:hypothetical protein